MISDEERLRRMHKEGFATRLIKERCHIQVSDAVKLARELGVPWTGKPIKEAVKRA